MPGILCEHCTAACCRYVALPIDEPESFEDYEDIRWYLLHEGMSVFVEDGEWFLNMATPCRHIQADYRCGIYETRPQICRDYTTDNCDYHSGDYGWEQHFTCAEHLDAYRVQHLPGKRKSAKQREKPRKNGRAGLRANLKRRRKQQVPREQVPLVDRDMHGIALPVLRLPA